MTAPLDHVYGVIDSWFPRIEGWCPPDKGKRMARLVTELPGDHPPLCVELGVFGGRGIIALGLAVKHVLNGAGVVHGIDPYTVTASLEGNNEKANDEWWAKVDYNYILGHCRGMLNSLGLPAIVQLKLRRSQEVVGQYADGSIDILHQDSNHSELVSTDEVHAWVPKLRPGGYWIQDDIDWATTRRAQELLIEKGFRKLEDHQKWALYQAP